jgi:undecaprenyl-diphosphatase
MINLIFIFGAKYLYLVIIIIAFIWFLSQNNPRKREILLISCICLPLIFIASGIAGRLYYNPRPFAVGNFEPLIPHQADNGFPSHHTLLVSAVSAIVFLFNRRLSLLLWFLALFVGFSRVYAGIHHIIDIIASIFISIIVITLIHFFWKIKK